MDVKIDFDILKNIFRDIKKEIVPSSKQYFLINVFSLNFYYITAMSNFYYFLLTYIEGFFTSTNQHRSNTVPPRMQQQQQQQQQQQSHQQQTHSSQQTLQQQQQQQDSSGNRPKRYSSLRQRPTITETSAQQNYPSQHAQHGYFPPQGNDTY